MLETYAMTHENSPTIFDREAHRRFRARAAAGAGTVDFLATEASVRLKDKLDDIQKHFAHSLTIGPASAALLAHPKLGQNLHAETAAGYGAQMVLDEEHLPIADASLNAVVSTMHLHFVNDLVGALIQMRLALKPDGLLLAMLPGARSLIELREVLTEVGATFGMAPRLSPLLDIRDAGNLLSRAGFALPTIDSEMLTVTYAHPMKLLAELKAMGQSNALLQRHRGLTTQHFWQCVCERYIERFATADGRVPMSIELLTLTAWAPDASQPKPAARGSGNISMIDALQ